jgi:hypothetical protein
MNEAFKAAVDKHQLLLAMYGEDDQRSIDALLVVMALAPDDLFKEIEQYAQATKH